MKIANILISNVWGDVSPEALERGIGGREGAMIYLSREWAKQGHEVTNFVNTESGQRFEEGPGMSYGYIEGSEYFEPGFHEYVPLNLTKPMLANFPWDVAIAWECPSAFNDERIRDNIKLKICEMQVAHFIPSEILHAEQHCDYVAALSEWHKQLLLHDGLDMPEDKVVVFPNGVYLDRYDEEIVREKIKHKMTDSPKFVYSSSPDRGLWQLLQSWKYIRKEFPGAELRIGYGVKDWTSQLKWAHNRAGEMAVEIERLMKQKGVIDVGKIGQTELAKLQLDAEAWLYPIDAIQSTETGCITAVENAAAGNPIITTDCDCMEEEFSPISVIQPLPFNAEDYGNLVNITLRQPPLVAHMRTQGRKFAEKRDWSLIADQWLALFKSEIAL